MGSLVMDPLASLGYRAAEITVQELPRSARYRVSRRVDLSLGTGSGRPGTSP